MPRTTEERHTVLETAYLASPDSSVLEQLKLCESTVFETNAWFKVLVLISPLLGRVPTPPGTTSSQNGLQIPALLHGRQELPHGRKPQLRRRQCLERLPAPQQVPVLGVRGQVRARCPGMRTLNP